MKTALQKTAADLAGETLTCCLVNYFDETSEQILSSINAGDIKDEKISAIFAAVVSLRSRKESVHSVSVWAELQVMNAQALFNGVYEFQILITAAEAERLNLRFAIEFFQAETIQRQKEQEITNALLYLNQPGADIEKVIHESAQRLKKLKPPTKAIKALRITNDQKFSVPQAVIKLGEAVFATAGNLSCVSGVPKGGKTAITSVFITGAISKDGIYDGITGITVEPNAQGRAVIHIDLEQEGGRHEYNYNAIKRRLNVESLPEYFYSYNFREANEKGETLDFKDYRSETEKIFSCARTECSGIHLAVIDGIADYITDVNNAEEANSIVKFFMDISSAYRCPVVVILHTNPTQQGYEAKERGHLGSGCQRKCESIVTVKKEGDVSFVEPRFLRMAGAGDVPEIRFTWDKEKGYHVTCSASAGTPADKREQERFKAVQDVCSAVFGSMEALSYGNAIEAIMRHVKKSEAPAKGIFKEMKANDLIKKGPDDLWRLNIQVSV